MHLTCRSQVLECFSFATSRPVSAHRFGAARLSYGDGDAGLPVGRNVEGNAVWPNSGQIEAMKNDAIENSQYIKKGKLSDD